MAEIDRIIKKGVVDESFLREEMVDDFLVTTDRKKLFAVLLDLLLEIDRVCKQNNIIYYLIGGTLLGAVRHKGFIPWDDDLDIAMTRENYEKFLKCKDEFKHPYFFQTPYTDQGFFWANITLRNSNTTAITPYFAFQPMNHGAFVDIFVLDNIVNDYEGRKTFEIINELIIDNSTFMRFSNPYLDDKNKKRVDEYKKRYQNPFKIYEQICELSQKFNNKQTDFITMFNGSIYGYERTLFLKTDFEKTAMLEFEGYFFPVPIGYKNVLKIEYNDFMTLPPKEARGLHHNIIFDMDTPYQDFKIKFH